MLKLKTMKLFKRRFTWQKSGHDTNNCKLKGIFFLPFVCFAFLVSSITGCKKDNANGGSASVHLGWSKAFGGSKNDNYSAFAATADGAYIVAGFTSSNDGDVTGNHGMSDAWVFKIDRSGNILWSKAFGGSDHEEGWSIISNPDNTYLMAGNTNSNDGNVSGKHGGQDIWLVKLSTAGNILWQKALGGSGLELILFSSIIATTDGGYMVLGSTNSTDGDVSNNHGGLDYWLLKLDGNGNIVWQKTYGGSKDDVSMSIVAAADGYLLTGQSNSSDGDVTGNHGGADAWVVKVDVNGHKLWQKSLGGSGNEFGYIPRPVPGGGYIMSGQTTSPNDGDVKGFRGDYDAWVVRTDANFGITWQKPLGSSQYEDNYSVSPLADGGYLVAALTNGNDGDVSGNLGGYDAWFVKLDSDGNIKWQKTFGGSGDDNPTNVLPTVDGGLIFGGQTSSKDGDVRGHHGDVDAWLFTLKGV